MTLREPFNAISHGVGALAWIPLSCLWVSDANSQLAKVSFVLYGLGTLFLLGSSALYHALPLDRTWPQKLDHIAIYVMIATTYVPVCLLGLPTTPGYAMLACQAGLLLIGLTANIGFGGGPKWLRLVLYLLMGWMAALAGNKLIQGMGQASVSWLVAGGLAYSIGTIVYASKRPNIIPGRFESHELWHCFVLAGVACHAVALQPLVHH
jgi:hemolysin III